MSKSIDYSAKAEVLNNGRFDDFVDAYTSMTRYLRGYSPLAKTSYRTFEAAFNRLAWLKSEHLNEYKECVRLFKAKKNRANRLNKRIKLMLQTDCVFCTLTFTDVVLERTSAETRHDYVNRWLKSNFPCSIANIDFGSQNGREHYHALVCTDKVDKSSWKYGDIDFKRVKRVNGTTSVKLSHYIAKLTNHAIKCTTKGNRVIYSGDVSRIERKYDCVVSDSPYKVSQKHQSWDIPNSDDARRVIDEYKKRVSCWEMADKGFMSEKATLEMLADIFG